METRHVSGFTWGLAAVLGLLYIASLAFFTIGNIRAGDDELWKVLVNGVILSIPLVLLYGALGVVIEATRKHAATGQVSPRLAKWLYWSPRIAAILIIFFVTLFSLDVFDLELPFWQQVGAFVIHSLPSIGMTIFLVLAWRWEWLGAVGFLGAAVFFLRFVIGSREFGFGNLLLFVLPMALVGTLFLLNWLWRAEIRGKLTRAG